MGTGWMWRRGGSPEELEARYGLRPLTWRDPLLWERVGHALVTAALWIALALWLLSGLYDIGPVTVVVVGGTGIFVGFVAMADGRFEADLRRWPRRLDTD